MAQLPLVYFSGVLGIHRSSLAYRTAYHCTPFAAALIWIGRQLLLEYALPKELYSALNWPAAASYRNQLQRLQYIQRKYLCRGSAYPMSRLLETLAYGRAIAKKEGPRTNISWSLDKQTLDLNKQLISMYSFRSMVWLAIQDAQAALHQLMFNWEPAIDLNTIQDSLVNDRVGWSFLSEPANGLQHSFRHLQQRAWHDKDSGLMAKQRWVPSKVAKYLQQVVAFQPLLLLCIHFTGGMPGRGTEIGTIRWCNTRTAMRSVFVQHAMLLIIIEYQKAQRTTNKAFYVVRALPPVVS